MEDLSDTEILTVVSGKIEGMQRETITLLLVVRMEESEVDRLM